MELNQGKKVVLGIAAAFAAFLVLIIVYPQRTCWQGGDAISGFKSVWDYFGCRSDDPPLHEAFDIGSVTQSAENGNMKAQLELAEYLVHSSNYSGAAKWYRIAMEKGDRDSLASLVSMIVEGKIPLPADFPEMMTSLRVAAEEGHIPSEAVLSYAYREGKGVEKSDVESNFWNDLYNVNWERKSGVKSYGRNPTRENLTPEQKSDVEKRVKEWQPKH